MTLQKKVTKEEVEILGSSRTDSGVHAKAYVANFKTNSNIISLDAQNPAEKVDFGPEDISFDFKNLK